MENNNNVKKSQKKKLPPSKMKATCYQFTAFKVISFGKYNQIYEDYKDLIRYMIVGEEKCPDTWKIHYQGFIQFFHQQRGTKVQRILLDRTLHIEVMYSNELALIAYSQKDGQYHEWGKFCKQGRRDDLESMFLECRDLNTRFFNVKLNNAKKYSQYRNGCIDIRNAVIAKEAYSKGYRQLETTIIVGDAGTGKTKYVIDKHGYENVYILDKPPSKILYFDGYDGEKVLLIDDFYGWIAYNTMLKILDGHIYKLNVKHGFTYALWDTVYITSNRSPRLWYKNLKLTKNFRRRIKYYTEMNIENLSISGPKVILKVLGPKDQFWKIEVIYDTISDDSSDSSDSSDGI